MPFYIPLALFIGIFLFSTNARGQQEPMYSHYMFNVQAVNPAYAGSWEALGITLLSRQQWMSFENNPETHTLTLQLPFANNKIGTGFSVIDESIGTLNRKMMFIDYSFGIKVSENTMLRLGVKGGVTNYHNRFTDYVLIDPDDPAIPLDVVDRWLPNAGIGVFLHSPRLFAGLSAPKMLQNEKGNFANVFEINDLLFMGGAVFSLGPGIDIKPSCSVRYQNNQPLMADLNLSLLIANRFWIGGMFRTSDEIKFGINTNVLIGKSVRLGYAVDFIQLGGLNSYAGRTHEVMVSFEFKRNHKTQFMSPRYF